MCGIAGFLNPQQSLKHSELLEIGRQMTDHLALRGPDSEGHYGLESEGLLLGHRRLAIIDLSPMGNQPMDSASGRYTLVFNGEIYNYPELRQKLVDLGWRFRGNSDTEVLLAGFEQWGVVYTLQHAVGMFAFALWDRNERALTLGRDRMGEKPLYYGWNRGTFYFASTPGAMAAVENFDAEIDRDALALFFQTNYIPQPYSIYKGIFKLPPGTTLTLTQGHVYSRELPTPSAYWSLYSATEKGVANPFSGGDHDALEELKRLLRQSVSGQMLSDVPLGAFLSGGVDSSVVVANMVALGASKVQTFTMGFEDIAYNESEFAAAVAARLGTQHTTQILTPKDVLDVVPKLPLLYDEPFADSSQVPTHLVALVAKQSVTVALSGDGGDEMFCGYNRHVELKSISDHITRLPMALRKSMAVVLRSMPTSVYEAILRRKKSGILGDQIQKLAAILPLQNVDEMYEALTTFWIQSNQLVLGSHPVPNLRTNRSSWPHFGDPIDRLLYIEAMTSLPDDMLVKVDRAAMGVSLETRVPLLDHRIVEFAVSLPMSMRVRDGQSKWLLRQALYEHVPRELIERPKSGFGVPIDEWLKGPLNEWAESLINESRLKQEGFLDAKLVRYKWGEHLSGRKKRQPHLWGVLMFQAWLEASKQRTETRAKHVERS